MLLLSFAPDTTLALDFSLLLLLRRLRLLLRSLLLLLLYLTPALAFTRALAPALAPEPPKCKLGFKGRG